MTMTRTRPHAARPNLVALRDERFSSKLSHRGPNGVLASCGATWEALENTVERAREVQRGTRAISAIMGTDVTQQHDRTGQESRRTLVSHAQRTHQRLNVTLSHVAGLPASLRCDGAQSCLWQARRGRPRRARTPREALRSHSRLGRRRGRAWRRRRAQQ